MPWRDVRMVDEQRDVEMGLEERGVVEVETVLAEALPVVARDYQHRVLEQPLAARGIVELAQLGVRESDRVVVSIKEQAAARRAEAESPAEVGMPAQLGKDERHQRRLERTAQGPHGSEDRMLDRRVRRVDIVQVREDEAADATPPA